MEISFHGAAQTVTGSKHLIRLWNGKEFLLDCGMFQGMGKETVTLNREFGFAPERIEFMILSHAHIDHSGLIPKLVKEGFTGKIYCTPATYDLCRIMLADSAHIQEDDIKFINKRRRKQGREELEPLYTIEDVNKCLEQFVEVDYDEPYQVNNQVKLLYTDNGHILGSATVNLTINDEGETFKVTFTGDIGRYNTSLLRNPVPFPQADILICESTYGDRLHSDVEKAEQVILDTVLRTCGEKKGRLIIPSFSLGRTQELVYALNKLNLHGLLPEVNIYVDSPLAVNATQITRKYVHLLNRHIQRFTKSRPDPFGFDKLTYITDVEISKQLNSREEPCVIISAAGMAEAGRVKHHIMHNISDPANTILLVGYAEPLSLAGRLRSGASEVKIYGMDFEVNAEVKVMDSLSAHGDYNEMLQYLSCQDPKQVEKTFLVHGDPEAQEAFKKRLEQKGFSNVSIPRIHSTYSF